MDLKAPLLTAKDFFTMGETSLIVSVPAHTLRYWESHVGFLRPARRSSGHRRYSRQDIETILLIKELIQRRKMTIAGARKALLERKKGRNSLPERQEDSPKAAAPATLKLLREVKKEIATMVLELSNGHGS